jgi:hypothetical protein
MVAHINTTKKTQHITYPDMVYTYINFKPNTYYYVLLKGFSLLTGYFDKETYDYIKKYDKAKLGD